MPKKTGSPFDVVCDLVAKVNLQQLLHVRYLLYLFKDIRSVLPWSLVRRNAAVSVTQVIVGLEKPLRLSKTKIVAEFCVIEVCIKVGAVLRIYFCSSLLCCC